MQDELLKDINELKKTVVEKDDIISNNLYNFIEQKELNINDHVKDYESKLRKKDADIADFKRKIEDMSNEFASMLRVQIRMYILFRKLWIKCKSVLN